MAGFGIGPQRPGGALSGTAIARALASAGMTDAQARTTIAGAASLVAGLRAVGLKVSEPAPTPTPTPGATGVVYGTFETVGDWSYTGSGAVALDTVAKVQGTSCVRYSSGANLAAVQITKVLPTFDMQTLGTFATYVALDDDYDWQCTDSVTQTVQLDTGSGSAGGTHYSLESMSGMAGAATGGLWVSGGLSRAPAAVQAAGVGNHRMRLVNTVAAPRSTTIGFDAAVRTVTGGKGAVIISFDDVKAAALAAGAAVMDPLGFPGESYVALDLVGLPGRATKEQLLERHSKGWSLELNGTPDDQAITTVFATPEALVNDLDRVAGIIEGWGVPRPWSFCYPFGNARKNGVTINLTNVQISGNVATVSDATGIAIGMRVVAQPFLAKRGCVVQAISGTTITLSETADTAFVGDFKCVDASGKMHGNKVQRALIAAGYRFGRAGTAAGTTTFHQFGLPRDRIIYHPGTATDAGLATMQAAALRAIAGKSFVTLYVHDWNQDLTDFCNWLKQYVDDGSIEVTTTRSLWQRFKDRTPPQA